MYMRKRVPLLPTDSGWKPHGVAGTTGLWREGHGLASSAAPVAVTRRLHVLRKMMWFYLTTRRHCTQDSVVQIN
jgi:hypothetical protein